MAADPEVRPGAVFFTAFVPKFLPSIPDSYAIHELRAGSVTSFAIDGNWVHPTAGTDPDTAWAEMVSNRTSRIVRFSPVTPVHSMADVTIEVEDAEQPVVSSDGELLAFMREVKGRNSLWIRHLKGQPEAPDHQLAGPDYDVREASFFPDHRVVFSSRRDGRFRLYLANPASATIEEMSDPNCSARYPAISPDGRWIAFSCEQGGSWQLHSMNLQTGGQSQLTDGDCNCISPAWTLDSKNLIYATDCGRGLGMTALAKLSAFR
jgi:dipeptidyl aminopeptidase/acylaminoacyl peptidase